MHRQERIEQVSESNSVRLSDEPEQSAVTVEAPRPAPFHDVQAFLVAPEEKLGSYAARGLLERDLQGLRSQPLDLNHGDGRVENEAPDHGPRP